MSYSNYLHNILMCLFLDFSMHILFVVKFLNWEFPLSNHLRLHCLRVHLHYRHFHYLLEENHSCKFFAVYRNTIRFLNTISIITIYIILVTDVIILWIIFNVITYVRILYFCIIRWSQRNTDRIQFVFFCWLIFCLLRYAFLWEVSSSIPVLW